MANKLAEAVVELYGKDMNLKTTLNKAKSDVDSGVKSMQTKLSGLKNVFAGIGIAAVAGLVTAGVGMAKLTIQTADLAEQIQNLATSTGLTVEQLQTFRIMSQEMGTSFEGLTSTTMVFQRKLLELKDGSGAVSEAMTQIGVSVKDADTGALRPMSELFPEIIGKLQAMTNESERNAVASQLFGRNIKDLTPILSMSGSELAQFTKRIQDSGAIMDAGAIKKLADFGDKFDALKTKMEGVKVKIAMAFLPVLEQLADILDGLLTSDNIEEWGNIFNTVLQGIMFTTRLVVSGLWGIAGGLMVIYDTLKGIATLQPLGKIKETLGNDFKAIGSAQNMIWGRGAKSSGLNIPKVNQAQAQEEQFASDMASLAQQQQEKAEQDKRDAEERLFQIKLRNASELEKLNLQMNKEMSEAGPLLKSAIKKDYLDQISKKRKEMADEERKLAEEQAKAQQEQALETWRKQYSIWQEESSAYESIKSRQLRISGNTAEAEIQDAINAYNQQYRSLWKLSSEGENVSNRLADAWMTMAESIRSAGARAMEAMQEKMRQAYEFMKPLQQRMIELTQGELAGKLYALDVEAQEMKSRAEKELQTAEQIAWAKQVIDMDYIDKRNKLYDEADKERKEQENAVKKAFEDDYKQRLQMEADWRAKQRSAVGITSLKGLSDSLSLAGGRMRWNEPTGLVNTSALQQKQVDILSRLVTLAEQGNSIAMETIRAMNPARGW